MTDAVRPAQSAPKRPTPLATLLKHRKPLRNVNKEATDELKLLDRVALAITERVGTMGFFLVIFTWTVLWLGWNLLAPKNLQFDPPSAFVFWLFISNLIQIMLMPLIMVGQNLQGRHSELRAENDLEVNIKAEKEIEAILQHLEYQNAMLLEMVSKRASTASTSPSSRRSTPPEHRPDAPWASQSMAPTAMAPTAWLRRSEARCCAARGSRTRRQPMAIVDFETDGAIAIVTINRPEARNAVDGPTAKALAEAFRRYEADEALEAAVLTGAQGTFCAGADLKAVASGRGNRATPDGDGPLGCTRMLLTKPVIAAVEGYAVAGGLELALWCDLRVAARDAVFGVFCRRFGVPLVDGGTIRLPRLIGMSRAMDMILTGRPVGGEEALSIGLANRLVEKAQTLDAAIELARHIIAFPRGAMRGDRLSAYEQWGLSLPEALANEFDHGIAVIRSGETQEGAARFAEGAGRRGQF
jgi:enoyl-CoA hydratase